MNKTRRKVYIDRLVGKPIAWVLNVTARILGRVMSRDHSITPQNVRTIAISKYVGMGSIIQATPLIRSLRDTYPEATIIFVTGTSCRRMLERIDNIDRIITVDDRSIFRLAGTTLRAIVQLMWARVDLYLDLEVYSAYASIISLVSLARNRAGFYRESAQHKRGNYSHLMYFNARTPIRYIYLQLGRLVGCEPVEPDRLGTIRVDADDRLEFRAKLSDAGVGGLPYIVVNANASDLLIERRWPVERFVELTQELLARYTMAVVLTGTPAEQAYISDLAGRVRGETDRLVNLAGKLGMGGLFALLEGAACVITNDTGPLHMAWALGAPTVALFGPGDPGHYGPSGDRFRVIKKSLYCSPCLYEADEPPCNGDNVCMQRIGAAEVVNAAAALLSAVPLPTSTNGLDPEFFVDHGQPLGLMVRSGLKRA
jgi:ADP-heptose:LPS heptosyltransferase